MVSSFLSQILVIIPPNGTLMLFEKKFYEKVKFKKYHEQTLAFRFAMVRLGF